MSVYINSPTASGCVNVSHFSLCMAVSHYVTLKCLTLCLCSGLCPGELSPVCGCRAPLRATTALSCGSDLENRWSLWQTCQNHPLKGKGGLTYWVCKCLPVQVLSSHQHLKKMFEVKLQNALRQMDYKHQVLHLKRRMDGHKNSDGEYKRDDSKDG